MFHRISVDDRRRSVSKTPVEIPEVAELSRQTSDLVVAEPQEMETDHAADGVGQSFEAVKDEKKTLETLKVDDRLGKFSQKVVAEVEEA